MSDNNDYAEIDVTCRTTDCGNCDVTLRVIARAVAPVVFCGVCAQEIQDKTTPGPVADFPDPPA